MATHEGALLASYSRGAKARTRSPSTKQYREREGRPEGPTSIYYAQTQHATTLLSNVSGWYILQSRTRFYGPEITPDLQSKAKLTLSRRLHKLKQRFSLGIFGKNILFLWIPKLLSIVLHELHEFHRPTTMSLVWSLGSLHALVVTCGYSICPFSIIFLYIPTCQDPKAITAGGGVTTRIKTRCMLRAPVTWHLRNEWFTTFQNYAQPEIAEALQY